MFVCVLCPLCIIISRLTVHPIAMKFATDEDLLELGENNNIIFYILSRKKVNKRSINDDFEI